MRSENYKKLLGSRKWKRLRMIYLSQHPLCEICLKEGRTVAATDVHHVDPIENYSDFDTMERVAYDLNNLQALCPECHHKIHEEMESRTASTNVKRAKQAAADFMEKWFGS